MREVRLLVYGVPVPQGSKTLVGAKTGRPRMIDANASKLKAWRAAIAREAKADWAENYAGQPVLDGPLEVTAYFYLPRPKTVLRQFPDRKPDLDKLLRALLDGISDSGVWADDARVVEARAVKRYTSPELARAVASIREVKKD